MNLQNIPHQVMQDLFTAIQSVTLNRLTIDPVLAPGGTATNFQVSAFSFMLGGVTYNKAAANNIAPPGFDTAADEFRKVLVCIDSAGTVSTVGGTIADSQEEALIPDTPANKLAIGVLELPAEFESGTDNVTAGMCKRVTHAIDNE
jgi:hypothetical protein